jgi:hypothetical protein
MEYGISKNLAIHYINKFAPCGQAGAEVGGRERR